MECRLCLADNADIKIFEAAKSVVWRIWNCVHIQARSDDGLPGNICVSCSSKLESFMQFKETCKKAEEFLRFRLMNSTKIKEEEVMLEDGDYFQETPLLDSKNADVKNETLTTTITDDSIPKQIEITVPSIEDDEDNLTSSMLETLLTKNTNSRLDLKDLREPLTVKEIKKLQFSKLSLEDKVIVKQSGRPTPNIDFCKPQKFLSDWYRRKKWLCGCERRNALFCFPCLLLGGDISDPTWTKKGFVTISKLNQKLASHENTKMHLNCAISLSLLNNSNVKETVTEMYNQSVIKHNAHATKNRIVLSKVIDYIKFCANFEISLEDKEKDRSENPKLFDVAGALDTNLRDNLYNSSVFQRISKTIQNELLDCMLKICRDYIATEIQQTSYVAVIVDDTTNVLEYDQIAIIFRYELNGEIFERFWGFFTPESQTPDMLSKCILDQLKIHFEKDPSKLIAQTFNGSNVVKDEKISVQSKIKETYESAHFVHSYSHQLNLIMKNAATATENSRIFFSNLLGIPEFFSNSPLRLAVLDKHMSTKSSSTSWNCDIQTVQSSVYKNGIKFMRCLKELQSMPVATNKTVRDSSSLFKTLNDDNFLFWLEFFHKLVPHIASIQAKMQSRNIDVSKIQEHLLNFNNAVVNIRNLYCESSSSSEMAEARQVCDYVIAYIKRRYSFAAQLLASKLFYKENFFMYSKSMPTNEVSLIVESYPTLDESKLLKELEILYVKKELHLFNGLLHLLNIVTESDLTDVLSETTKLIKILLTTPMITNETERCFSSLNKIRTFLRNNPNHERLTALAMISIENNMISKDKHFNEKVIDLFSQNNNKKMDFILK